MYPNGKQVEELEDIKRKLAEAEADKHGASRKAVAHSTSDYERQGSLDGLV